MSDSVRPHRRQPTRPHRPWDSPGKNTGVGCHFLLQCMKVKSESEVTQLCLTPSDPMDCSPPGSSIHGIFPGKDRAFHRKVLSLSLFFFFLTIPQFGLLSQVSSLKLSSGHSGLVLTLSNAARASQFSLCLLVADMSVWATSLLGVQVRRVICGFYLFTFPPGYVAL